MGKKTKDAILELLEEGDKPLPRAPVKRREVSEIPDALVLCVVHTTCRSCNKLHSHPNPHILGRYRRDHKRIKKWSSLFEQLPREMLEIQEEATACANCFESCVLRTGDVEGSGT